VSHPRFSSLSLWSEKSKTTGTSLSLRIQFPILKIIIQFFVSRSHCFTAIVCNQFSVRSLNHCNNAIVPSIFMIIAIVVVYRHFISFYVIYTFLSSVAVCLELDQIKFWFLRTNKCNFDGLETDQTRFWFWFLCIYKCNFRVHCRFFLLNFLLEWTEPLN
jgi:hypothetical protein